MSFAAFAVLVAVVAPAFAHMEVISPTPLRNKANPQYANSPLIDYSYKAPLAAGGDNFPCKGYHVDVPSVSKAVDTVQAGSNYTVQLSGGAVHDGGSCQFSFSYDGGNSWGVVHQIVGNCPISDQQFSVPIPAELPPAKDVLLAWSWFNKVGNREMYMNCAAVDVMSSGTGITLPMMFRANTFGGDCIVKEGSDVDFANPAGQVENCPADKLVTPDKTVTFGAGGSAPPASTPSSAPPAGPSDTATSAPPAGPTDTPPATGGAGAWVADKVYNSGDSACYNGQSYTAKWWTQGETPGAGDVWGTGAGSC
ncbi:hypothetical protein BKA62DRAFT_79176 [Auriculariales sp. MPI-PUGE-AT-0066]|nr:hypothetical protein BKA62DRAFT_79176 [Auriculariales sp. MPI-PUGE-AT-0066]